MYKTLQQITNLSHYKNLFIINNMQADTGKRYTINLDNATARNPEVRLNTPATVKLADGEHIAIIGANGAGKSLLADMLAGKYLLREGTLTYDFTPSKSNFAYENIRYITFRDAYGNSDFNYCYQMRWNHTEQDDVPETGSFLNNISDKELRNTLFEMFEIEPMLHKKVVALSSGELRKLQLVRALSSSPRILIMDNPFIGLDASTRKQLCILLEKLSRIQSLQIILILSVAEEIPDFITHVIPVSEKRIYEKQHLSDYRKLLETEETKQIESENEMLDDIERRILDMPYENEDYTSEEVIRFNNVNIRYGEHSILHNLNWTVHRGEVWALRGDNGSGKSTLLSLVCADNPQSYACDISLFGRKRGTGESIWEIKKHIGYVSPEMHRAYMKDIPAAEIAASGFYDTIGLYCRPSSEQISKCEQWMDIFGITSFKEKSFIKLSSGEQRLCLLVRAFVKDPELLILDEPLHGLDTFNRRKVKRIIEAFCKRKDKTVIMVTHYENELPATITDTITLHKNR